MEKVHYQTPDGNNTSASIGRLVTWTVNNRGRKLVRGSYVILADAAFTNTTTGNAVSAENVFFDAAVGAHSFGEYFINKIGGSILNQSIDYPKLVKNLHQKKYPDELSGQSDKSMQWLFADDSLTQLVMQGNEDGIAKYYCPPYMPLNMSTEDIPYSKGGHTISWKVASPVLALYGADAANVTVEFTNIRLMYRSRPDMDPESISRPIKLTTYQMDIFNIASQTSDVATRVPGGTARAFFGHALDNSVTQDPTVNKQRQEYLNISKVIFNLNNSTNSLFVTYPLDTQTDVKYNYMKAIGGEIEYNACLDPLGVGLDFHTGIDLTDQKFGFQLVLLNPLTAGKSYDLYYYFNSEIVV